MTDCETFFDKTYETKQNKLKSHVVKVKQKILHSWQMAYESSNVNNK